MYINLVPLLNYLLCANLGILLVCGLYYFLFVRNRKDEKEKPDIFQLKGEFNESSFSAMLSNIPDEEESARLTKERDEKFMFYNTMEEWIQGNNIKLTYDNIMNRIKPFVVKYCKVPVVSYDEIPYMMETIWYKKDSKTGLTNVIKTKFTGNKILLYSVEEDAVSIIIKYARIEKGI
jgi:hypothetical protein